MDTQLINWGNLDDSPGLLIVYSKLEIIYTAE